MEGFEGVACNNRKVARMMDIHFGTNTNEVAVFLRRMQHRFEKYRNIDDAVECQFHVDGRRPSLYSSHLLWLVLGGVKKKKSRPFVVGFFRGNSRTNIAGDRVNDPILELGVML